jgi:Gas vesicle synthesis protein GvpL/GvpF
MGIAVMPTPAGVAAVRGIAYRLVGVVNASTLNDAVRLAGAGAQGMSFRDVAAIVRPCPSKGEQRSDAGLLEHHTQLAALARTVTVLPAPPFTTFRTVPAALQWLELHAVALADGLAYVDGRCGARVTAERDLEGATSDPAVLPPSAAAVESFRALRRHASATVPVDTETVGDGRTIATEAFLVERGSWDRFTAEVAAEDARSPGLTLRVTGPWPVYDFVRLQF